MGNLPQDTARLWKIYQSLPHHKPADSVVENLPQQNVSPVENLPQGSKPQNRDTPTLRKTLLKVMAETRDTLSLFLLGEIVSPSNRMLVECLWKIYHKQKTKPATPFLLLIWVGHFGLPLLVGGSF